MSSDLERFRDHARHMATPGAHRPECCGCGQPWCCGCPRHRDGSLRHPTYSPDRNRALEPWQEHAETCPGNPAAPCCQITATDRAEWERQANEIDAYLARLADQTAYLNSQSDQALPL